MNVGELIEILEKFSPEDEVQAAISWPDRVTETHKQIWVGDWGGGPQINLAMDLRGLNIYVGCTVQTRVADRPKKALDLGRYESTEEAAKVRDFYIFHKKLDEPLNFPDFDYEDWIPPRTTSGDYNEHIAEILKEKLLED